MVNWINVEQKTPENGKDVLLFVRKLYGPHTYVCVGFYAMKNNIQGNPIDDFDFDIDEETGTFYLPEGFYETIKNWDSYDYVTVNDRVTHWMEFPDDPDDKELVYCNR